jgi:hypothetical protein
MLTGGVWLVYLAFLPPGIYSIDGNSMLAVSHSLVSEHSFEVPAALGMLGRNGHTYSTWYPLQSLLAVPVVAAGLAASNVVHVPAHYVEAMFASILPPLYTAITVSFVYLIAIALGGDESGAWLASITYAFGTIAMVYARSFFADPLLALLTAAATYFVFRGNAVGIVALLSALAVLAKPTGLIIGPILAAYLVVKNRTFWSSLLPAAGSALGLALYFIYNYYRFGNPLTFEPKHIVPSLAFVPQGIAGLLISPGVGLIWYCPCVILVASALWQIAKSRRLEALAICILFVGTLLLHSCWFFWNAGWAWGPRYLLSVLPGIVGLMGVLVGRWRRALAVLAVAGFLISAPTLISFYERYYAEAYEHGITVTEVEWSINRSPLLHAWPAAVRQLRDAESSDVRELFRDRGVPSHTIANSRALRIVAVWWWVLPIIGVPRLVGFILSLVLTIVGILMVVLTANEYRIKTRCVQR